MSVDRAAIAERIRGLFSGQSENDPAAAALRLGVDEVRLRSTIDGLAPTPTLDVIVAIVVAYGVDPTWLLTGNYDPGVHRNVLAGEVPVDQVIARLMPGDLRLGNLDGAPPA
jgi:hypothetical protein